MAGQRSLTGAKSGGTWLVRQNVVPLVPYTVDRLGTDWQGTAVGAGEDVDKVDKVRVADAEADEDAVCDGDAPIDKLALGVAEGDGVVLLLCVALAVEDGAAVTDAESLGGSAAGTIFHVNVPN